MLLRHLASPDLDPTDAAPAAPEAPRAAAAAAAPDPSLILPSIGEVVYDWDIASDRLTWGPNLAETLGAFAASDISLGQTYGERVAAEGGASRHRAIMQSAQTDRGDGVPYQVVYGLTPPRDGNPAPIVWVEDTGRWYAGPEGKPARAHGVLRVVSARHEAERKLALGSQLDPLTGILNRAQLAEHANRFLSRSQRSRRPFAVLLIALENLFGLNRTYGYDAGDEVIAGLARRLRANVRACDVVARHAGNKFGLVLDNCDSDQARAAASRLLDAVKAAPFETSAGLVPAAIRIGAVIAPREGRSAQMLFQRAEEALDVARQAAGRRFVPYASSLAREDARLRALQVADNIVSALNDQRVELAFQPIVHAVTGDVAFHEALLRLRLPDGAWAMPSTLLPVAEKAGLVQMLDRRVMDLALERLRAEPDLRISIKCSIRNGPSGSPRRCRRGPT